MRVLPGPILCASKECISKCFKHFGVKKCLVGGDRRSTVGDHVNFLKSRNYCMSCLVKGMAAGTRLSECKEGQGCHVVQYFELDRHCTFLLTFCCYSISDAAGCLFLQRAGSPRLGKTPGKRMQAVEQERCSSSLLLPFGWP